MVDFEERIKKTLFLKDTLAKKSQYIVAYSFVLEHPKHFFYFEKKNLHS